MVSLQPPTSKTGDGVCVRVYEPTLLVRVALHTLTYILIWSIGWLGLVYQVPRKIHSGLLCRSGIVHET